jgi:hypothetical protein
MKRKRGEGGRFQSKKVKAAITVSDVQPGAPADNGDELANKELAAQVGPVFTPPPPHPFSLSYHLTPTLFPVTLQILWASALDAQLINIQTLLCMQPAAAADDAERAFLEAQIKRNAQATHAASSSPHTGLAPLQSGLAPLQSLRTVAALVWPGDTAADDAVAGDTAAGDTAANDAVSGAGAGTDGGVEYLATIITIAIQST